ncbi:hypothetical protein [Streptomyces sp. ME19-01-6]|uniref:hypothetical protein n=1 Tax=Streptomyces sp. ME19-01-6 TaxID=3028686 RepID=UPI0029BBF56B|nr:hypothetical protein [Streptomyces sp. ME19-01-6]MDX3231722.1 hypothetical protein [Streptomyces sp. ME19-01-6]
MLGTRASLLTGGVQRGVISTSIATAPELRRPDDVVAVTLGSQRVPRQGAILNPPQYAHAILATDEFLGILRLQPQAAAS